MNNNSMKDRRSFLVEGLKKGGKIIAGTTPLLDTREIVKMLTPDGKVVEVDKRFIKKTNKKTSNEEILHWMENPGIKVIK